MAALLLNKPCSMTCVQPNASPVPREVFLMQQFKWFPLKVDRLSLNQTLPLLQHGSFYCKKKITTTIPFSFKGASGTASLLVGLAAVGSHFSTPPFPFSEEEEEGQSSHFPFKLSYEKSPFAKPLFSLGCIPSQMFSTA